MTDKLTSFLRKPCNDNEKYLESCATARVKKLVEDIDQRKFEQSVGMHRENLCKIDKMWCKDVSHPLKKGSKRAKRILLQSCDGYSIDNFFEEKFGYKFHYEPGAYKGVVYTYPKFLEVSKMEVAMLLCKYGDDLMRFEVEMAIVELLFSKFEVCKTEMIFYNEKADQQMVWTVQSGDIQKCINEILEMNIYEYTKYFNKIAPKVNIQKHARIEDSDYKRPKRPQNKQELLEVYRDGMTIKEFTQAIMAFWGVSERTAGRLRQKFELSRSYKSERGASLNDLVSELREKISILEQNNKDLTRENDALKNKIKEFNDTKPSTFLIDKNNALENSNAYLSRQNELLRKELEAIKSKSAKNS